MISFGLNVIASQAIYKDLIAGRMINQYEYSDGELKESNTFKEIINDIDKYRELYALIGFTLKDLDASAFFLTRSDRADEFNETAANIQTILLIICRGLGKQGIATGILLDDKAGVSMKVADEIGTEEEAAQIMKACGIKQPLSNAINSTLLDRGLAFKNLDDRYVFTDAGKAFFKRIFNPKNNQT